MARALWGSRNVSWGRSLGSLPVELRMVGRMSGGQSVKSIWTELMAQRARVIMMGWGLKEGTAADEAEAPRGVPVLHC